MEYELIRSNNDSLKDISKLYLDCFGIKVDESQLQEKYDTSLFELSFVGFLAYKNASDIAAYYGVFPVIAKVDGKEVLIGQSGDTMTASNHRKKGLFVTLAKKTYELAAENNMSFVFGFPNENSLPGFERKLGWEFYGRMQQYKLKGSTFSTNL